MTQATNKQIPMLVMALFAIGAMVTLYLLFGLANDLALQAGVLSSGEVEKAEPFLMRVQVLMTVTLAAGFVGLLILSRQSRVQEVYVERMRQKEQKEEADRQAAQDKMEENAWIDDLLTDGSGREELFKNVFDRLCKRSDAVAGAFYTADKNTFTLAHHYALALGESQKFSYESGEGLVGQSAKSQKKMVINDVPENSMRVISGLGESTPRHLVILPLVIDGKTVAVSEIGTFAKPEKQLVDGLADAHQRLSEFLSSGKSQTANKPAAKEKQETNPVSVTQAAEANPVDEIADKRSENTEKPLTEKKTKKPGAKSTSKKS